MAQAVLSYLILALILTPFLHASKIQFSGMAAIDFMDAEGARSHLLSGNRSLTGNSSFDVQKLELYFDANLKDDAHFYGQLDWDGRDNPELSLAYLRFDNAFNHGSSIDFGKILNPVGSFSRRQNPQFNPLYGNPLIYDYRTNLRSDSYPANAAELVALKGNANRNITHIRNFVVDTVASPSGVDGMPLINPDYPTGLVFYDQKNNVDYYLGITNNSLSSDADIAGSNYKNILVKIGYTGARNNKISFSYSSGSYLDSRAPMPNGFSPGDYLQTLYGVDYQYTHDRWKVHSELVWNTFESPRIFNDLETFGYYLEGQYFWEHNTYTALRVGGLAFNDVLPLGGVATSWDDDVSRVEFGLGHYINEDILGKLFIQNTSQDRVDLKDNLFGLQVAAVF